jgi:hypothetical protein
MSHLFVIYPDLGILATYFNEWCDVTVASHYGADNGTDASDD